MHIVVFALALLGVSPNSAAWNGLMTLPMRIIVPQVPPQFHVDEVRFSYDDDRERTDYGYTIGYRDKSGNTIEVRGYRVIKNLAPFPPTTSRDNSRVTFTSPLLGRGTIGALDLYGGTCLGTTTQLGNWASGAYTFSYCGKSAVSNQAFAKMVAAAKVLPAKRPGNGAHGFTWRQWQAMVALQVPIVLPQVPADFHVLHVSAGTSGERSYRVTFGNGRATVDFSGANGGFGGVDPAPDAFAAHFHSPILGSGTILNSEGCIASNDLMMYRTMGFFIRSCNGGLTRAQVANMVNSARIVH